MRRLFLFICIVILLTVLSSRSYSASGSLDYSFGLNGIVSTPALPGPGSSFISDIAVQNDGRIIVVGSSGGNNSQSAVLRYNSDGSLDPNFDLDGIRIFSTIQIQSIALQADGKILLCGNRDFLATEFALARLNADGSFDSSFGTSGTVTTAFPQSSFANAVAIGILPSGKIFAAGYANDPAMSNGYALAIYQTNGVLERQVIQQISAGSDQARDAICQSDGKIILGGDSEMPSNSSFTTVRFNVDATLDTSYGTNGIIRTDFGISRTAISSLAIQPDGKIMATGVDYSDYKIAVARYNPNGTLDSTFDDDGRLTTQIVGFSSYPRDIALQQDGKIIVSGIATGSNGRDILLTRYTTNGGLDPTFGRNGIVLTSIHPNSDDGATSVEIQLDGKILVGGFTGTPSAFAAIRYLSNEIPTFDFDGDRKTDLSIFRPNGAAAEWWWLKSSTGGNAALQFGASTDRLAPVDFTGDGKTDVAFWRPSTGQWFVLRSEDFSFYAFPFGANGDVPVPADFDGDGKADPAVFRESSSTWFINKSSGGTDIFGFGSAGDKTAVADYDGDGKADVAIFRPVGVNGAEWWVRRSSNAVVVALQFGASTDKAVPGDFTGDGKADIAFWRPSTGFWNVLRSEDLSYFAFPFGTTGDVPVAGDYDGDGKTDAGVFRPSNSTWFIQRSTAGTLIQQFGAAGDVPLPSAFVR